MLSQEQLIFIVGGLGGFVCILLLWIINLHFRLKRFMKGSSDLSLEGTLAYLVDELKSLNGFSRATAERTKTLEEKAKKNVGSVGIIRFNAFNDMGGNQSFSTAFLNDLGDGVLFSGIYGRDRVVVYAKPVEKFSSLYELSPEEKDAIGKAQTKNV